MPTLRLRIGRHDFHSSLLHQAARFGRQPDPVIRPRVSATLPQTVHPARTRVAEAEPIYTRPAPPPDASQYGFRPRCRRHNHTAE